MPLSAVVHQHAPPDHPQPALVVQAKVPDPRPHDPRHLEGGGHFDPVEMPAPRIVAADDGFLPSVAGSDPQVAGGVPSELPGRVVGPALLEARTQAAAVQADDPPVTRRQQGRARRVRDHVVHPPDGAAPDLRRAVHALPVGEPAEAGAGEDAHGPVGLGPQAQDLVGRQAVLGGVHLDSPAVEGGQSPAEGAEPQPSLHVLGDGHHREMGQAVRQPEALEGLPIEPAHPAVCRGDPEQASSVLVDVLDQHAGQAVLEGVLAGAGVGEGCRSSRLHGQCSLSPRRWWRPIFPVMAETSSRLSEPHAGLRVDLQSGSRTPHQGPSPDLALTQASRAPDGPLRRAASIRKKTGRIRKIRLIGHPKIPFGCQ